MIYKPQPGDDERPATRPGMIKGTPEAVDAAAAELTGGAATTSESDAAAEAKEAGEAVEPRLVRSRSRPDAARRGGYPGRGVGPGGGEFFEERVDVAPEK